ncbi:MAG: SLC13 family permease [Myxococcota bacterium]|nr:SLC13 family permease [Myxococcota bacterium]
MSIAIVLAVVVLAIVLFSFERIPLEVSALTIVCVLALTGVLEAKEAFAGFSNDTVIFIFALLAMTQGLASTGVVQLIGQWLASVGRYGHQAFVAAMMLLVAVFSSLVSNTVTTAAFLPVAVGAANRAKVPKSKVLMPLAYASMLGGTVFLYGTSTNLVMSEAMTQMGLGPIGIAELTPMGIPVAIVGFLVILLLGPRLLPVREGGDEGAGYMFREYITEAVLTRDSRYTGRELAEITKGLGIRVLGLLRDGKSLPAKPGYVMEGDEVLLVEGSRDDIMRVKDLRGIELRPDLRHTEDAAAKDLMLFEAQVSQGSNLVGRSLKETLFAERFGLVVLALHRRPAIQRVTKLQLLGRIWGENSLSTVSLAVGDVLLLRGPRDRISELSAASMVTVIGDVDYAPPRYAKAAMASVIFGTVLVVGSLELVPLSLVGITGMLLMIATGCVDSRIAFRVDWKVVLLIGSMLALGVAMEKSGAGRYLGTLITPLAEYAGPRGVLVALMLLTIVLSAPMSNQAAGLVVLPIGIAVAHQLGIEPRSFAIGICLAASCSFITPLEPSCVLVYGPGHYRFSDFFRLGTPLTLALLVLLSVGVPLLWPFQAATGTAPAVTQLLAR